MSAPTLTQVPVHGTFTALDGSPAVGYVSFTAVPAYRMVDVADAAVLLPGSFSVPIDANGEIYTDVSATDDFRLGGASFFYKVTVALADAATGSRWRPRRPPPRPSSWPGLHLPAAGLDAAQPGTARRGHLDQASPRARSMPTAT
jgi:hypothetical protein